MTMTSFMDDRWYLCGEPESTGTCDDEKKRRTIEIRDLPDFPGVFSVAYPEAPPGYGYFCMHANPLLITVFFTEPLSNGGAYVYAGQVTYHNDSRRTIIKGKKRSYAPDGKLLADDDWTSNRPVAG